MEVFQEGGRLVAGSQRLNETAETLLDHPYQIPQVLWVRFVLKS